LLTDKLRQQLGFDLSFPRVIVALRRSVTPNLITNRLVKFLSRKKLPKKQIKKMKKTFCWSPDHKRAKNNSVNIMKSRGANYNNQQPTPSAGSMRARNASPIRGKPTPRKEMFMLGSKAERREERSRSRFSSFLRNSISRKQ
jgi:hypothetical protein